MPEILTPHLCLPLPHPDNSLAEDVLRIRDALTALDQKIAAQDGAITAVSTEIGAVNAMVASQLEAQNTAINAQLTAQNEAVAQQLSALQALVYSAL